MYSLALLNLDEFKQESSDNEQYCGIQLNIQEFPITEITHSIIELGSSIETVGNMQNSQSNHNLSPFQYKETQNTAIQIEKSFKSDYTETLAIFQRIYSKIVSSYLGQVSSCQRKSSKKTIYFDKCQIFRNLQLESSFITLKEVINRCELQFSQKSHLFTFLNSHHQLRGFLSNSLPNGYEEINNEFIYFVFDVLEELKTMVFKSTNENKDQVFSIKTDSKDKQIESKSNLERQKLMKKQLEEVSFFERIFYQKKIKFLNCQQISTPVSDERLKQAFIRFARLYSHLIIKLIIMEGPGVEVGKNLISFKRMNSCQERLIQMGEQSTDGKNINCNEIFGNWFLNTGVAKSFNSINSLGSINLNNLNDIKIYSSKQDLWSQTDEDKYYNFSDEELDGLADNET